MLLDMFADKHNDPEYDTQQDAILLSSEEVRFWIHHSIIIIASQRINAHDIGEREYDDHL